MAPRLEYECRHGTTAFLSAEILRVLRRPCPPMLTNYGVRGECWELPESDIVIGDPALAVKVETLFRRLHPARQTDRTPDWLKSEMRR